MVASLANEKRLAAAATAACVAETATFPLDLIKTRLQLSQRAGWRVKMQDVGHVVGQRGLMGMYSGCSAAVLRHIPYTSIRIATFERLKDALGHVPSLYESMIIGCMSGALGQFVASPFDLVKVRLIADASQPPSRQRYSGVVDAFRVLYSEKKGLRGMWKGCGPAVQRAALVNIGELTSYDWIKNMIVASDRIPLSASDTRTHVLSSLFSGFCSSLISTPADVVKSRMMNDSSHAYSSSLHCLRQTWQQEGLSGLYKGFGMTWLRLGPWQVTFWTVYEKLR